MVGDADFKGIFNFKPHSPCEMELSASDTVLRMAQSEKPGAPPCLFGFRHGGISVALLNNGRMKEAFSRSCKEVYYVKEWWLSIKQLNIN